MSLWEQDRFPNHQGDYAWSLQPPGKSSKDGELFRVAALGVLELTSMVLVKLVKIVPALHLISQFVIPAWCTGITSQNVKWITNIKQLLRF